MRVEPPTKITSEMSSGFRRASARACSTGSRQRRNIASHIVSNRVRVTLVQKSKVLPFLSCTTFSISIEVCKDVDNIRFAFSATFLNLRRVLVDQDILSGLSVPKYVAFFFVNSCSKESAKR